MHSAALSLIYDTVVQQQLLLKLSPLRTQISWEALQKIPSLIKHYYSPAATQGYWVTSCILLVNLGYQGSTGKRDSRADKHQTRRPGLVRPLHHSADLCRSVFSEGLQDESGTTYQGIFN